MALAVVHVGGTVTGVSAVVSDSWTSTAASLIVCVGQTFGSTGSPANGDITDSKGNTYTLGTGFYGGAANVGIGIWYNNAGTRGAAHTCTYDPASGVQNISVVEITGQDLTAAVYDSTTAAHLKDVDGLSPFNITAAAAISGNQIAVYALADASTNNFAWTQPSGYTNIINQPNGGVGLVSDAAYKINETGTPTVGATNAETSAQDVQVLFATFKEAGAAAPEPTWTSLPRLGMASVG